MPAKRNLVIAGARGLAAVAALAVGAGAVAAAALVPWPEHRAQPASLVVEPSESAQVRVCPGPLLSLADDAAAATTASSFGAATLTTLVEPADAVIDELQLEAPGNPDAGSDGAPVSLASAPGEVGAGLLAGTQSQRAETETVAGLAVASCREAVAEAWLVGGSTALGRTSLVLLANPTDVAATVDLRVYGEAGPVDAPSALGLLVPARSQRVISLAGLAPNVASPVVQMTAEGGRIAATIQQTAIDGLVPAGAEFAGAAAQPGQSQLIPGVVLTGDGGVAVDEDHAEGDAFPALRLFAPGEEPVVATIGVVSESGGAGTSAEVELQPGQVTDVPLGELAEGAYSIVVEADAAVVAAARSVIPSEAGTAEEPDGLSGDLAWFTATSPLVSETAVAVADAPSPQLHLVNPGETPVQVTVAPESGADRTVEVAADGAAELPLTSGQGVVLRGAAGLHASVSYRADRAIGSAAVEPPGPLDAPIRVYPR